MEPRLIAEEREAPAGDGAFEAHIQRALLLALLEARQITGAQYERCIERLRRKGRG